ncbi:MAG: MBL fold metallo-hydrolase [Gemmatimonadales bacterium]|nr:MAG: MBL fold metallo-hydrolase [Gemmatimonadales bacterium]
MHVQFFGAAREVTGSAHLVDTGESRVLLDCGLYQGNRKKAFERNRDLPFEAASIDAVVLSHAHLDHAGNLPTLIRSGFRGTIWTTHATADLCEQMLMDSAHIQVNDVKYVNKRRKKHGQSLFEPLYTAEHVDATLERFRTVDYEEEFQPALGVRVRLDDAGHILGSASVTLDLSDGARERRLLFSGDIGRKGLPILRDPVMPPGADVVIMESTYGGREHAPASQAKDRLRDCAEHVCREGGYLIIPAFSLGRTQEVVYRLNQLWEAGELPRIPVWVDSPLAVRVTDVFNRHRECWDAEMLETMHSDHDSDPLGFEMLTYVRDVEESKALNDRKGPGVIISASGMCEAGRILHHLRFHATNPASTVLFVGYQAEHTLGRKILDGNNPVRIYGEDVGILADVERADSYSAHAGRSELLAWADGVREQGSVGQWFLVHGEPDAQDALAEGLRAQGAEEVMIPDRLQRFEI